MDTLRFDMNRNFVCWRRSRTTSDIHQQRVNRTITQITVQVVKAIQNIPFFSFLWLAFEWTKCKARQNQKALNTCCLRFPMAARLAWKWKCACVCGGSYACLDFFVLLQNFCNELFIVFIHCERKVSPLLPFAVWRLFVWLQHLEKKLLPHRLQIWTLGGISDAHWMPVMNIEFIKRLLFKNHQFKKY